MAWVTPRPLTTLGYPWTTSCPTVNSRAWPAHVYSWTTSHPTVNFRPCPEPRLQRIVLTGVVCSSNMRASSPLQCVLLQDRKGASHCFGCQYGLMEEINSGEFSCTFRYFGESRRQTKKTKLLLSHTEACCLSASGQ